MNIGLSCPILWTGHVYSIISNFLFICVSYLDVYSPMFIYFLFYAYIYGLFVAVTCIFLASNSAIFCQENRSGYIGVCKNYKIKDLRKTKSKISEILNLSSLLTYKMDLFSVRVLVLMSRTSHKRDFSFFKCRKKILASLESQYKRDPH